jgi:hypothetical protein
MKRTDVQVGELSGPQLRAGVTALALGLCLFLPWYRSNYTLKDGKRAHDNLTAFGAFSWVEAAVFVIVGAVLYLLWARYRRRGFHLPGGDGWAVTIAGFWCLFLLVWRLFDRPGVSQGNVGVQWGLFVTMIVAGALGVAGQRMRSEHRPEPPNPAEDPTWEMPSRRDRARRPVDPTSVTRAFGDDRPEWEGGDPPEPPGRVQPSRPKEPPPDGQLF